MFYKVLSLSSTISSIQLPAISLVRTLSVSRHLFLSSLAKKAAFSTSQSVYNQGAPNLEPMSQLSQKKLSHASAEEILNDPELLQAYEQECKELSKDPDIVTTAKRNTQYFLKTL